MKLSCCSQTAFSAVRGKKENGSRKQHQCDVDPFVKKGSKQNAGNRWSSHTQGALTQFQPSDIQAVSAMKVRNLMEAATKAFFGLKQGSGRRRENLCDLDSSARRRSTQHTQGNGSSLTQGALTQIQPSDLQASMHRVAAQVSSWDAKCFVSVKRLQEAARNHGHVDMMRTRTEDGGRPVAVKCMPNSWVTYGPQQFTEQHPTSPELPWRDLAVLQELNSRNFPNVCELIGVYRDGQHTYVVTSLATEGDLFSWCERAPPPGKAREALMKPLTLQLLSAVRWMHDLGVAHRDLSLENIVLMNAGGELQVKIIDFGMCTVAATCLGEVRGKPQYQAPEMHLNAEYSTFLADEFAIGVAMFAMAAQDYPWKSTKPETCPLNRFCEMFGLRKLLEKRQVITGAGEALIQVFSPALVQVLDGLLQRQPSLRFSVGESCFTHQPKRQSVWDGSWMVETE